MLLAKSISIHLNLLSNNYNEDEGWQVGSSGKDTCNRYQVTWVWSLEAKVKVASGGRELTLQSCLLVSPHTRLHIPTLHSCSQARTYKKKLRPEWKPDICSSSCICLLYLEEGKGWVTAFNLQSPWIPGRTKPQHTTSDPQSREHPRTLYELDWPPWQWQRRDCSRTPWKPQPRQSSTKPHPHLLCLPLP